MKILAIRISNINSIRGNYEIDFQKPPLSEAPLFAVTGTTGAGKSTILDAICLALFNKIPRFLTSEGKGRAISKDYIEKTGIIIKQHILSTYAEVDYQVKGVQYRTHWSIGRTPKGKLKDYEMWIAELPSETPMDLKKSECPSKNQSIIGLNFNQFIKSTVLAQGQFTKLLHAGKDERVELLEKLTGQFAFRAVSKLAYGRAKEEECKINQKTDLRKQLSFLDSENFANIQQSLKNLTKQQKELFRQLKILEKLQERRKNIEQKQINLALVNKEISQNEQNIQNNTPNFQRLKRHHHLLYLKTDIDKLWQLDCEIKALSENIQQIEQKIQCQKNLCTQKQQQKSESVQKIEQLAESNRQLQKLCSQIDELDKTIDTAQLQYKHLKNHYTEKETQYSEAQKRCKNFQKIAEEEHLRQQKIQQWLQENKNLAALSRNHCLIVDCYKRLKNIQEIITQNISKNQKLSEALKGVGFDQSMLKIKDWQLRGEEKYRQLQTTLTDKNRLESDYTEILELIKPLHQHVIDITNYTEDQKSLQKEYQQTKEKAATLNSEIKLNREELALELLQEEELRIRKERQTKEANLKILRSELKESQPCPLCGATHHPYQTKAPELQIQTIQSTLAKVQNMIERLRKQQTAYLEQKTGYEKDIEVCKKQYHHIQQKLNELMSAKERILETVRRDPRLAKINLQAEILHNNIKEITRERTCVQEIAKIKKGLQHIELLISHITQYENIYSELTKQIVPYQEKEKKICQEILARLQTKKNLWEKAHKKFNDSEKLLENAKTQILDQENIAAKILTEKQQRQAELNTQQSRLKELKAQRQRLFGCKDTQRELQNMQQKYELAEQSQIAFDKELIKLEITLAKEEENLKKHRKDKDKKQVSRVELSAQLMPQLEKQGYDSLEATKTDVLTAKDAEYIINEKENLEKRKNSLAEKSEILLLEIEELAKDDDENLSDEALAEQYINTENENKIVAQQIKEKEFAIKKSEETKKQYDRLSKEIKQLKKKAEKWYLLNDYIGSSDGKKFASYAQELVLVWLLGLANERLKKFNDRYQLSKYKEDEDTNDLYVIDRYQADMRRSVKSLSGGESFLMSLALALGLSDMASQNAHIESLFIDEGFGNLDEEALEATIATLETLQAETGKTIGIISHISSLKERIQTKINIVQEGNGFSSLTVE